METKNIYWAAGFLEGEGTFRCTKSKSVNISAPQKSKELLYKLQILFDGYVYDSYTGHEIPQWQLSGEKAVALMMTLYSLMSTKRKEEIKKALDLWKKNPISNQRHIAIFGKCKKGHDWVEENIYIAKNGNRRCKSCLQIRSRVYSKQYYLNNKETIKETTRLWKENNKSSNLEV